MRHTRTRSRGYLIALLVLIGAASLVGVPGGVAAQTAPPSPDVTNRFDAQLMAQLRYCATAAPPIRLPLPIDHPISIPPQDESKLFQVPQGGPSLNPAEPPPTVTAPQVAVIDEASGRLLYGRDPFRRSAPASVTKIVSASVALEALSGAGWVNVPITTTVSSSAMVACDGSSVMGLEPGERVSLRTLLYGMMLPSGNDAAEQVAAAITGSRERFVALMNARVERLGLRDSHFANPTGMDADNHYSSAYDLALLARDAMRDPVFRQIVGTVFYTSDGYFMRNLNPVVGSYAGADGVKIGYTDEAGRTIVASATRDGRRVYVVLMHSANLNGDTVALMDWVWRNARWS